MAFFFSAISTQVPNKKATKRSGEVAENEDHCVESEDDFITPSQVSSKSSQSWVANHPSIVDKKLRPSIRDWSKSTGGGGGSEQKEGGSPCFQPFRWGGSCYFEPWLGGGL